MIRGRGS